MLSLPPELFEHAIDFLHSDRPDLGNCALVCRAWLPRSRFHLFSSVCFDTDDGFRAAHLNHLLSSPRSTIPLHVQTLELRAQHLFFVRDASGRGGYLDIASLAPRLALLQRVSTLVLFFQLPATIIHMFPHVQQLHLHLVTIGPLFSDIARCMPRLVHIEMTNVVGIPCRLPPDHPQMRRSPTVKLRVLRLDTPSLVFLDWIALFSQSSKRISIPQFYPSEMQYLVRYLEKLDDAPESLDLVIPLAASMDDYAWADLACVLGPRWDTRLSLNSWLSGRILGGPSSSSVDRLLGSIVRRI
ncbi:unnamed protein product [Mycena citricolor]|uniref:F-box domain-containing protein n=1 Tax=Mycena citricolor TaxID=2018698 RepID=A0AAD2HKU4_9AGAR|nr:unnamed protein product [Mycena citricolor]